MTEDETRQDPGLPEDARLTSLDRRLKQNDMCTAESIHTIIFHYVIIELQKRMKGEREKERVAVA